MKRGRLMLWQVAWILLFFWLSFVVLCLPVFSQEAFQWRSKPGGGLRLTTTNDMEAPGYCFPDNTCLRTAAGAAISGTIGHVPIFTSSTALGDSSLMFDGIQFTTNSNFKVGALDFPLGTYLREDATINSLAMRAPAPGADQNFYFYGHYTDVSNNGGIQIHAGLDGTNTISSFAHGSVAPTDLYIDAPSTNQVSSHSNWMTGIGKTNPRFYIGDGASDTGTAGLVLVGTSCAGGFTVGGGVGVEMSDGGCGTQMDGTVLIGGTPRSTIAPSTSLEIRTNNTALLLPRLGTGNKLAMTAADGMIVYDNNLQQVQGRVAGAWVNLGGGGTPGATIIEAQEFFSTCTTTNSSYDSCTGSFVWTTPFADTNYIPVCVAGNMVNLDGSPACTFSVTGWSTTQLNYFVQTMRSQRCQFSTILCHAIHP